MERTMLFLPLLIFLVMAVLLYGALGKDPQFLPSALVDKPLPEFDLPILESPKKRAIAASLIDRPALLNVWASWCYACRVEHPYLSKLANEQQIPLYGLNYKNDATDAKKWLEQFGNPYIFSIHDREGLLGIDLGVAGAPETFLIDKQGIIRMRHVGIVDENVWAKKFAQFFIAAAKE